MKEPEPMRISDHIAQTFAEYLLATKCQPGLPAMALLFRANQVRAIIGHALPWTSGVAALELCEVVRLRLDDEPEWPTMGDLQIAISEVVNEHLSRSLPWIADMTWPACAAYAWILREREWPNWLGDYELEVAEFMAAAGVNTVALRRLRCRMPAANIRPEAVH